MNRFKKVLILTLIFCLVIGVVPNDVGFAVLKSAGESELVREFVSTDNPTGELVRADVTGNYTIRIEYRSTIPATLYRMSLYQISGADIKLNLDFPVSTETDADGQTWYYFVGKISTKKYDINSGNYNLYIKRCRTEEQASNTNFGANGVAYKNLELQVTNYKVRIVTYPKVEEYNDSIIERADAVDREYYLDNTLEDFNFVLRNPQTKVMATMYPYKVSYIKSISDRICQGIDNDYDKCKAIYEYTASNFYYDIIALQERALQYADPYDNIYNFENKRYAANAKGGIVYTTCQGYSAIYIALCRAQGIPSRMIYGHHLSVPKNNWYTEETITNYDHWWAESYVDGRWIFVDCTAGTSNQYNKNTAKVRDHGLTNYTFFDPSKEQIAQGHVYMNVHPDYIRIRFLTNTNDIGKLRLFLDSESNGSNLREDYDSLDLKTWGDGLQSHAMTDGHGNLKLIKWDEKGLKGLADFSGIKTLKTIWLRRNNITDVNLSGDTALSTARFNGNPLSTLIICINGKDREYKTNGHGTFDFKYIQINKKKLVISVSPDIGYKFDGLYNLYNGALVSKKTTITYTPSGTRFELRFVPNPDSYVYLLRLSGIKPKAGPYLQAAAKRLNELGYYTPTNLTPGTETAYSEEMADACYKFRLVNGLVPTKVVNKVCWKVLFSTDAKEMVTQEEYDIMLNAYLESLKPKETTPTDATPSDATATDINLNDIFVN